MAAFRSHSSERRVPDNYHVPVYIKIIRKFYIKINLKDKK